MKKNNFKNNRYSTFTQKPMDKINVHVNDNSSVNSELAIRNGIEQRNLTVTVNPNSPKFLSYGEVSQIISNNYTNEDSLQSTIIDIIGLYLKGQKILYTEAKVYCEQKLYFLSLPAIFISGLCTVLSMALDKFEYGSLIVSILTAFNTFLLSVISYLKLDGKAEAHKSTASSFDKLQSICEFYSGKILFGNSSAYTDKEYITYNDFLNNMEMDVRDIKEKNNFILPESIRFRFKNLYLTNIFGEVKRLQNQESILINELKILVNDIIITQNEINNNTQTENVYVPLFRTTEKKDTEPEVENKSEETNQKINSIDKLNKTLENKQIQKDKKIKEILEFKNKYIDIDKIFREEIENDIKNQKAKNNMCQWLKN